MKSFFIAILFLLLIAELDAQSNLLEHPDYLPTVEKCLRAIYGFNFETASELQEDLQQRLPDHPAPYFLKTLLIYWENFPLLPDDPEVKDFERNVDITIKLANEMMKNEKSLMEGVFFDMHARAYRGMFWADNGKPSKVLFDLDNMYRSTMIGIEFKKKFNEFYFSSGLYNYYIEKYVEKRPEYKPLTALLREGNKELGLKELQYAIDSTTYIKYDAILFMSLVQLNYEENLPKALEYAAVLYNSFPKNIYYLGQYLIILLHSKKYLIANLLNDKLKNQTDPFYQMIYLMTAGFIKENSNNEYDNAQNDYLKVIKIAESYGPIADVYASIAYAGMARIAEIEGDEKHARKYRKRSAQLSRYDFILDFGNDETK